jgi:hypothetical protein
MINNLIMRQVKSFIIENKELQSVNKRNKKLIKNSNKEEDSQGNTS